MMDVRLNGQSLKELLAAPPKISDQVDAVCRTLELTVLKADGLVNYIGQRVELWYNGKRWYVGLVMRRKYSTDKTVTYVAYDPLYFLKRNKDDFYIKGLTATQGLKMLATASGIRLNSLANTAVVLPPLHYPAAEADKVALDLVARTYQESGKKYWYRYKPDDGDEGLTLFERKVPSHIWAFQVGVNLTAASLEESIEETATIVKLVNRDTGKVVVRAAKEALESYGPLVHFEEVDKDQAKLMDTKAKALLEKLSKVGVTMGAEGINPDAYMPQFFSGDAIYIEEPVTGLVGGYYIRNVTQTFESDALISLSFDVMATPDVPTIQYDDADDKAKEAAKKAKDDKGKGVKQEYSAEVKAVMDKYGLSK